MRRNLIAMVVGSIAAFVMLMPATSAMAVPDSAALIDDESADSITQIAKTHTPQTDEQQFETIAGSNAGGNSESQDNAIQPYSLDDDLGSESDSNTNGDDESSTPGNDENSNTTAPADGSLTASADLSGLTTVGVTWRQQDMDNPDNAPTYQLRYFTGNAWSDWVELPSLDEDAGKIGTSPSYYVGNATKAEAKLTAKNGQQITEAKLITIDSGYSVAGNPGFNL